MVTTGRLLAHRTSSGVEVKLIQNESTGALKVSVSDKLSGGYFELEPEEGEALQAFRYPWAVRGMAHARSRPA